MPKISANIGIGSRGSMGGGIRLGANIFVGGEMDSATGFTIQAGWSIADGVAHAVATGSPTSLIKSTGASLNTSYRLEFDVLNYVSGNLDVVVGSVNLPDIAENGHYSVDFTTAAEGNTALFLQGYILTADIDNVSVRQIL